MKILQNTAFACQSSLIPKKRITSIVSFIFLLQPSKGYIGALTLLDSAGPYAQWGKLGHAKQS